MVYNIKWSENAKCVGLPTTLFFDSYETNPTVCIDVDELCMSCPVQTKCLAVGVARKEWGVWGGIYLEDGLISDDFNNHKTQEDWSKLWLNITTQIK
jgi:Transcription factor WhiB